MRPRLWVLPLVLALCGALAATLAAAPLPRERVTSANDFATTVARLAEAARTNGLMVVTRIDFQRVAQMAGGTVPGNQVLGLFAPKYAGRLLKASVDAGIEAPIRIYVTEDDKGKVTISYFKPSVLFAPYGKPALDALGVELDPLIARTVATAAAMGEAPARRVPERPPARRRTVPPPVGPQE